MLQYNSIDNTMELETILKNGANLKSLTGRGLIFFIIIPILFASCTAKIYTKSDAKSYTMRYKTLAILPPKIKIEVKGDDNIATKQEQEKTEALNAQNEMYSRMLTLVQKRKVNLDIQDIEHTNAALLKMGYSDSTDTKIIPEQLAQALGVDAVLQSDYVFSQRRNVAGGILVAIVFFPYGTVYGIIMAVSPTRFADVNMRLYDGKSGSLLYSYNNKHSGLNVKYIYLVDAATKKTVKKSPLYR